MDYEFDNIEDLQRKPEIEAEGVELGLDGDITLIVRAATDANPAWKAAMPTISKERRSSNTQKTDRLG